MQLTEFVEKAKSAPNKTMKYEFGTTGAFFFFRPLGFSEMHIVAPFVAMAKDKDIENATPTAEQFKEMAEALSGMVDANLVVKWEGLKVGLFEALSKREIEYEDDELIPAGPPEVNAQLVKLMLQDNDFAMFITKSVSQATNELVAQKKS